MDQSKIGSFLKELRKEKDLTQEQLAENFGVSSRTVSRWENGNNMPDISMLVEIAEFYDVDIRELIDGERKSEKMDEQMKDTLIKVAEYSDAEKEKMIKSLHFNTVLAAAVFFVLIITIPLRDISSYVNAKLEVLNETIAVLGFIEMFISVLNVLQIKGSMSKNRMKKVQTATVLTCVGLVLGAATVAVVLLGFVFGEKDLARDTNDISDYGRWDGLLVRSNMEVFPDHIPEAAIDAKYSFYNDASFDPSALVCLECTYDEDTMKRETARLESIEGIRRDDVNFEGTAYVALMHKFESEYALVADEDTIVYIAFAEGTKPVYPDKSLMRKNAPQENDWFSVYDGLSYDELKYWPDGWKN